MLKLFVTGDPAPQGSKRHVGGGVLVESCKRLPDWRKDVRAACLDADGLPKARFDGAVCVHLDFVLHRPKSLPKTKPTPPHTKKPDLDKITRAIGDALKTAGVYQDDSCIVFGTQYKRTAEPGELTGVHIIVAEFKGNNARNASERV